MQRRYLLGLTAGTILGWPAIGRAEPPMDLLSAYMAAAGTRTLPPEVVEQAKHHLLDTLAAMVSGSELAPGKAALRYIRGYTTRVGATVVASGLTAEPQDAALANGMMAHSDETDDSHNPSRTHPGCATVPAALAVGEHFRIDGARFLRAVALGYDVGTRVVMAMGGAAFIPSYSPCHDDGVTVWNSNTPATRSPLLV